MAPTKTEEIQRAEGLEKDLENGDTTDIIFWGYFVELTDVTIRPIEHYIKRRGRQKPSPLL